MLPKGHGDVPFFCRYGFSNSSLYMKAWLETSGFYDLHVTAHTISCIRSVYVTFSNFCREKFGLIFLFSNLVFWPNFCTEICIAWGAGRRLRNLCSVQKTWEHSLRTLDVWESSTIKVKSASLWHEYHFGIVFLTLLFFVRRDFLFPFSLYKQFFQVWHGDWSFA